jgi:hypothetical protein
MHTGLGFFPAPEKKQELTSIPVQRRCDTVSGCGLDYRGSIPGRTVMGFFLFATESKPILGLTQPPIQWVPGALTPEVDQPRREADNSPPFSAEVKNAWIWLAGWLAGRPPLL